ncbi:laccase-2-like [Gossypium australe]|uniref:Laccase-2-like n=1 Tax=Gossypium australe TaxID=47621 RepID=A0A5B6WIW6_9ROSI|nr:laccase-2-like [Gossypium australe]
MENVFETDLGEMTYFLGMEAFALKILRNFCTTNNKIVSTPVAQSEKLSNKGNYEKMDEKGYRSLGVCLLYLTTTKPDIIFAISLLSRFMDCCNAAHFKATKRVLRNVKGTLDMRFKCLLLSSQKQQIIAQSTEEAKFIAVAAVINQATWLRKLLCDLNES